MCWPPGRELTAQNRNNFLTEQIELLEHRLQRQSGVIHQEQLALVVTEEIGKSQGLLDDLFRGTDGQRRLLGELFE